MKHLLAKLITAVCVLMIAAQIGTAQDAARKTVAITYPLGQAVDVQFHGTTRFPRLRGQARVERKNKTGTKIEISLQNLPRPYELGGAYTTYILWAITPEGQVDNIGELKFRYGTFLNPRGVFTTTLQTFALIVTAEPHYLVKRPSTAIILENIQPAGSVTSFVDAQYFGNSSDYLRDPRAPEIAEADYVRTPVALLEARQALNLAKFAGAQTDAAEEFEYAQKSVAQAETAWRGGKQSEQEVDVLARNAIAAGVKAEDTAGVRKQAREARNEKQRNDAAIRRAETAADTAAREREDARAELERERRNRELAERDVSNSTNQLTDLKAENQRLRDEIARLRAENENAKVSLAKVETERQVTEANRQNQERINRIRANEVLLTQQLKAFGAVQQTARGITVTLPENLFSGARSPNFSQTADLKLQRLAQVLLNNPDYKVLVESHTDAAGTIDIQNTLTDQRAQAFAQRLQSFGLDAAKIEAKGLGATVPISTGKTAAARAKNRRVELTLILTDAAPTQTAQQ